MKAFRGKIIMLVGYLIAPGQDALSRALDQQHVLLFFGSLSGAGLIILTAADHAHGLAVSVKLQCCEFLQPSRIQSQHLSLLWTKNANSKTVKR